MTRKYFLLFCILLFNISIPCFAQNKGDYFITSIESYDRVKPSSIIRRGFVGKSYVFEISNQKQFESLCDDIKRIIESGHNNITVIIKEGIYHFKENHIFLQGIESDCTINIIGKDAILTSCSSLMEAEKEPWLDIVQSPELIEVIDPQDKLCKIPFPNNYNGNTSLQLTKVQVSQWYLAPEFDINRVDNSGIYFKDNDLSFEKGYERKGYNVNFDFIIQGIYPRFRLYNKNNAVGASASCFFYMENTRGINVNIQGLVFNGSAGAPLIKFRDVKTDCIFIHDCLFEHIHGNVGLFSSVNNVVFDNNKVCNTSGYELRFINNCENVHVTNNFFENCGKAWGNSFCISCWESSYYIANNIFRDFGYGAIGVGVWEGFHKRFPSKGIIEKNEIYYTEQYFKEYWKHSLMDSGAIYCWTQNDEVIIRYNFVHDYKGVGYNRGIYCDDGANNVIIYGNVILNVPSFYSIDSRRVRDQRLDFRNNSNNFCAYNIVDNGICFMGYDTEERHCQKGPNIILYDEYQISRESQYENLEMIEEDLFVVNDFRIIKNIVKKRHIKKILKKNPWYNKKKQYHSIYYNLIYGEHQ